MKRFLASLLCTFLLAACAVGQIVGTTSYSGGPTGFHGSMTIGAPFSPGPAITDAPYYAEEVDEHVQTLADGTHIRSSQPGVKTYRDSMGRTRTERQLFHQMGISENSSDEPIVIEINDPVAHVKYMFDLDEPVAHRQKLPLDEPRVAPTNGQTIQRTLGISSGATASAFKGPAPEAAKCLDKKPTAKPSAASEKPIPQTSREDLGTQIIEGVSAEGRRIATEWPVGSMGNDRPFITTSETWRSPDLNEIILSKSDDPRNGEHTHKLVNISRGEPDPSLFEPPPGYTIKDEKGGFTINWGATR
jgi:hypothetical protein